MADIKKDNLKWWILITVIVGTFLGRLDQTIVSLAMPNIMDDFGITVSAAGWISTAYIIANAVFVQIWGKLGDIWGRKKVYIIGFSVFIIGSVLCSMSWNLSSMIVFRIIQAIAGSADYPTAMAIIAVTFRDGKERAQALGLWSTSFAAAAVFGPLIGGPLVDNFGWPSVFWINLPVGIVGLIMAMVFVHESRDEEMPKNFDLAGALALGSALASLVLVLEKGVDWGWTSTAALACYFLTIASTVLFVKLEKRAKDPIVDMKFFKNSVFMGALINNFIIFLGMMTVMFLIPVYVQTFMGLNATETGILFMPMAFAMVIASPIGGQFNKPKQVPWIIAISTLIAMLGMSMFTGLEAKSTKLDIILPIVIMAFGMGLGMAQRTNLVSVAVPKEEIGSASSVLALARNIAGAFGIAIAGTVLTNAVKSHAISLSQSSVINVFDPATYTQFVGLITLQAQILAYRTTFWVGTAIVAVGVLTSFLIKVPEQAKMEKVQVE